MLEPREVVQQPGHRRAVAQLLEQRPRPLGVRACEHPAPLPLGDERRLEERIGGATRIRRRLGQLQRALDVLLGGDPVAVSPMTPRAPMEDVRAQAIGGQVGALRQHERLVEEDDRLGDARLRVADDADPEHDLGAVDVGEPGAHGQRGRLLEQRHRRRELPEADVRPRLSEEQPERERRRWTRPGPRANVRERLQRVAVPRVLEHALRIDERGLEPLGHRPA